MRIILFINFTLTLTLLMSPLSAGAKESTFEKAIARGLAAIEEQETATAVTEFQLALAERPDDPMTVLYLGIAQNQAKYPEAETTLKRALLLNPESPRTNLELAILYLRRNLSDEASDYLDTVQRTAPKSAEAEKARELLRELKENKTKNRWWARLQTGMQYDTNVLVNATDAPLPPGFARKSDWRGVINGSVGVKLLSTASFDLSLAGTIYQSLHTVLSEFDVFQPSGELNLRYRLSPAASFKATYGFDYLALGTHPFATDQNFQIGGQYMTTGGHTTSLEYRLRSAAYRNSDLFPTNTDRSGETHFVGLTQYLQMTKYLVARVGYGHEEDVSRQKYWQFSGNRGLAGVTIRLPYRLTADLSGEFNHRDYGAAYPSLGVTRRDNSWSGSSLLSYSVTDQFSLTAGYYYAANGSNIASFDYTRGITTLFAQVRF